MFEKAYPTTERFVDLSFDIADRATKIMGEKGFTMDDLAAELNLEVGLVRDMFSGVANLTLQQIAELENVLGEKLIKVT